MLKFDTNNQLKNTTQSKNKNPNKENNTRFERWKKNPNIIGNEKKIL